MVARAFASELLQKLKQAAPTDTWHGWSRVSCQPRGDGTTRISVMGQSLDVVRTSRHASSRPRRRVGFREGAQTELVSTCRTVAPAARNASGRSLNGPDEVPATARPLLLDASTVATEGALGAVAERRLV